MRPSLRALTAAVVLAGVLASAVRSRPGVALPARSTIPRLPLLEHLIARGDIDDPSPMVRPFRRADALRALAAADTDAPAASGRLRACAPAEPRRATRPGGVAAPGRRPGVQPHPPRRAPSARPRRRPTRTPSSTGEAVIGPVRPGQPAGGGAAAHRRPRMARPAGSRAAVPGARGVSQRAVQVRQRLLRADGRGTGGRSDSPGIGVSNYGYPQVEARLPGRRARPCSSRRWPARSQDETDTLGPHRSTATSSPTGASARLSDRVRVGLWETTVISGIDREFDGRYRNPLSLLLFTNQYRPGRRRERAVRRSTAPGGSAAATTLEAQLGIDDLQYENTPGATRYPEPLGADASPAFGPLGRTLGLAGVLHPGVEPRLPHARPVRELHRRRRRARPQLRRHGPAHAHGQPALSHPLAAHARADPAAPGRGRDQRPLPGAGRRGGRAARSSSSAWSSAPGAPRSDLRGRQGPLDLAPERRASTTSSTRAIEEGRTVNRFEGRLQATLGFSRARSASMRAPPAPLTRDRVLQLIQRMKEQPRRGGGRHHARPLPHRRDRAAQSPRRRCRW